MDEEMMGWMSRSDGMDEELMEWVNGSEGVHEEVMEVGLHRKGS